MKPLPMLFAIVSKTTGAGRPKVDFAKAVIDEVTVVGSRCGPFKPALEALAQKKIDVRSLIIEVFLLRIPGTPYLILDST